MTPDFIALAKWVADMFVFPLCVTLWNMNGRLSKIEGQLEQLSKGNKTK